MTTYPCEKQGDFSSHGEFYLEPSITHKNQVTSANSIQYLNTCLRFLYNGYRIDSKSDYIFLQMNVFIQY